MYIWVISGCTSRYYQDVRLGQIVLARKKGVVSNNHQSFKNKVYFAASAYKEAVALPGISDGAVVSILFLCKMRTKGWISREDCLYL